MERFILIGITRLLIWRSVLLIKLKYIISERFILIGITRLLIWRSVLLCKAEIYNSGKIHTDWYYQAVDMEICPALLS